MNSELRSVLGIGVVERNGLLLIAAFIALLTFFGRDHR
jgi:hypothetical protein